MDRPDRPGRRLHPDRSRIGRRRGHPAAAPAGVVLAGRLAGRASRTPVRRDGAVTGCLHSLGTLGSLRELRAVRAVRALRTARAVRDVRALSTGGRSRPVRRCRRSRPAGRPPSPAAPPPTRPRRTHPHRTRRRSRRRSREPGGTGHTLPTPFTSPIAAAAARRRPAVPARRRSSSPPSSTRCRGAPTATARHRPPRRPPPWRTAPPVPCPPRPRTPGPAVRRPRRTISRDSAAGRGRADGGGRALPGRSPEPRLRRHLPGLRPAAAGTAAGRDPASATGGVAAVQRGHGGARPGLHPGPQPAGAGAGWRGSGPTWSS